MTAIASSSTQGTGLAPLIAALTAVGPLTVDTYLPSMPEIARALNATPLEVQHTLTAYMFPFAAMTLWHGAISDALGRRRVILWGTALYILASVGCVFVRSIESLMLFRALQGMTAGAGMVVGRAVVRDLFDGASAQKLMSQVTLVFALAPAVAPILGGWLQVWFGWRSIFVFLALFGVAAWVLCRVLLPETLPPDRRQPLHAAYLLGSYTQVMRSVPFLAASAAGTLNFSGIFIYIVSAPVFIITHLGLSETSFFWVFVPITIGMAAGAALSSRLAGRYSTAATLKLAYSVMVASALANLGLSLLLQPTVPWSILPLLSYSFGMSLAFPTLTISGLDLFPAQRGLASSCQSFIQTVGAALNAVFVPLIWSDVRTMAVTQLVLVCAGIVCARVHFATKPATD